MIQHFTRLMLAMQLACIAGLTALFMAMHWLPNLLMALIASALLVTLPRAAIIFNNFFLANALNQASGNGLRANGWTMARMMLHEFYVSTLCWLWLLPFAAFRRRHIAADMGLPVLLVHGYGANSGFWRPCSKLLSHAGISHEAIELEPLLADIDDYADLIHKNIGLLCQASGQQQVILLAHSMGGLAARAYLRRYGVVRIARLITLGTPHFGSTLANYAMGINARQMQRAATGSQSWLDLLAQTETPDQRALCVSLYSRHDNIVSPQDSAHLPGASNVAFDLIGHVALGFDGEVLQAVMKEITAVRQSKS
jgi:triacylglycerol esterase/lipase EstA (alpha/beta hydrolase family)